jgi:hypothetical protein
MTARPPPPMRPPPGALRPPPQPGTVTSGAPVSYGRPMANGHSSAVGVGRPLPNGMPGPRPVIPGVISSAPVNYGRPPANGTLPGPQGAPGPRPMLPGYAGSQPRPRPVVLSGANAPLKRTRDNSPPPAAKKKASGAVVVSGSAIATVDKLKIRKDYVPKALRQARDSSPGAASNHSGGGGSGSRKKKAGQVCPRCGESIPHDELEQHVRIELLDPKWKEQREKEIEWKRTRNLDDAGGCPTVLDWARRPSLNCYLHFISFSLFSGTKSAQQHFRVPY